MKKKWIAAAVILVIAVGVGYYYYQSQTPLVIIPPTMAVSTTVARVQNIPIVANAMGTLLAPQSTTLEAQQVGIVTGIYFASGQQVKKGDLLFTLDNVQQQAALSKAQAAYLQAKEQYRRYQILAKQPGTVISQSAYDLVESTYKQAQAVFKQAQENLAETKITAPFDGKLGTTNLALGSFVQVGTDLVPIVNLENIVIEYVLPETDFAYAKVGQAIQMKTDVYPSKTFNATVNYISPQIDSVNRTFTVRAKVPNVDDTLSPGMLMSVVHILAPIHKVLAIPAISLIPEVSGYGVYIVKDNKVAEAFIVIGQQYNQWVEVLGGLTAGQAVISEGQQKVKPGASVNIVTSS
ncbi:MAG: efflux RND transporter periplasmic adaptor subunit [Gammaproteobacteria bacterium]|nr:efflux RND transporter periplasmic adaptor subunit [Gammaproteobacteria bacterium]